MGDSPVGDAATVQPIWVQIALNVLGSVSNKSSGVQDSGSTGISATLNTSLAVPPRSPCHFPTEGRQSCYAKDAHTGHACIGADRPASMPSVARLSVVGSRSLTHRVHVLLAQSLLDCHVLTHGVSLRLTRGNQGVEGSPLNPTSTRPAGSGQAIWAIWSSFARFRCPTRTPSAGNDSAAHW